MWSIPWLKSEAQKQSKEARESLEAVRAQLRNATDELASAIKTASDEQGKKDADGA